MITPSVVPLDEKPVCEVCDHSWLDAGEDEVFFRLDLHQLMICEKCYGFYRIASLKESK